MVINYSMNERTKQVVAISGASSCGGVGGGGSGGDGGGAPMGRWGHSATMITESKMLVLGGQADDDAHQATLGDMYKFDLGALIFSAGVSQPNRAQVPYRLLLLL